MENIHNNKIKTLQFSIWVTPSSFMQHSPPRIFVAYQSFIILNNEHFIVRKLSCSTLAYHYQKKECTICVCLTFLQPAGIFSEQNLYTALL